MKASAKGLHTSNANYTQAYRKGLLKDVKESINKDIPVTILYLLNNAKFYKYDEYLLEPEKDENMSHYVNVTEVIEDKISGDTVLTISSWGGKVSNNLE